MSLYRRIGWAAAMLVGLTMTAVTAGAEESCGTCAKEIVTNTELAACFLDNYDAFAGAGNGAVFVDLSTVCPQSRGVFEALAGPSSGEPATVEPSLKFMLSRAQLACLKKKLEAPGVKLDPSATIELGSCG